MEQICGSVMFTVDNFYLILRALGFLIYPSI